MPDVLTQLAPDPTFLAAVDQFGAQERDRAVGLVREVELPAVPSVGDEVVANPNFMAVPVERVAWLLDDQQVVVELGDLDEDEVGPELALELLLESGWQREAELA